MTISPPPQSQLVRIIQASMDFYNNIIHQCYSEDLEPERKEILMEYCQQFNNNFRHLGIKMFYDEESHRYIWYFDQ